MQTPSLALPTTKHGKIKTIVALIVVILLFGFTIFTRLQNNSPSANAGSAGTPSTTQQSREQNSLGAQTPNQASNPVVPRTEPQTFQDIDSSLSDDLDTSLDSRTLGE